MTNREIVESYIPLAKFIAQVCGPRCEVLLHDLSDIEHSIIYIEHNHITGRSVGGAVTDFALRTISNKKFTNGDFIANYYGKAADNERTLKSSTFYIRNGTGEIVGLLCTNMDITEMIRFRDMIDLEVAVTDVEKQNLTEKLAHENFAQSVGDLVDSIFAQTREETGYWDPEHMLIEEKKEFVSRLYEKNLFMLKGAVGEVAKRLLISEPTVYRYLREISITD